METIDAAAEVAAKDQEKAVKRKPATFDRLRKKKPVTKKMRVWLEDHPKPDESEFWPPTQEPTQSQRRAFDSATEDWLRRMDEDSVMIIMQSVGRRRYDQLIQAHPPTDAQMDDAEKKKVDPPSYNIETFTPALLTETIVEPQMTSDQIQVLFDDWGTGEIMRLFFAALEVNTGSKVDDFVKSSGRIQN